MIYRFTTTFNISVTGEIEADSYDQALSVAESITAAEENDNKVRFDIPGKASYTDIEIDHLPDIDIEEPDDDDY